MINLEEEARKRRERLLRNKTAPVDTASYTEPSKVEENIVHAPRKTEESHDSVFLAPEGLTDASGAEILSLDNKIPDTLEAQAKALLAKHESSASTFFDLDAQMDTQDLLAPKGQNADLKREYERRTAILQKQTRRAIVDIVRERLAAENNEKQTESEE